MASYFPEAYRRHLCGGGSDGTVMRLPTFLLEEYLERHEFTAPYLFCTSDAEALTLSELLALAGAEDRERWEKLSLGYTEVRGLPRLREEIARRLYPGLDPDDILTFAGAQEGIFAAIGAMLNACDHAVVVSPCYQSLRSLPQQFASSVTEVALDSGRGWELDIAAVRAVLRPDTRLIVINFPHNPTGAVLDRATQEALVGLARERDIAIFSDEVYRSLEPDPAPPMAVAYERGVSLNVLSKAYGLPGLRIGWIATRDRAVLDRARRAKHYLSICNAGPSEILALIALRAGDSILARNRAIVRANRSLLDDYFGSHRDYFRWQAPPGGCIAFPELLSGEPVDTFARRLRETAGVLVLPAGIYRWPGNHFRIGFGRRQLPEALERFANFVG